MRSMWECCCADSTERDVHMVGSADVTDWSTEEFTGAEITCSDKAVALGEPRLGMDVSPCTSASVEPVVQSTTLQRDEVQAEVARLHGVVANFRQLACGQGAPCLYVPLRGGDGSVAPARFRYDRAKRQFWISSAGDAGTVLHPPVLISSVVAAQRERRFVVESDALADGFDMPGEIAGTLGADEAARAVMIVYEDTAEPDLPASLDSGRLLLLEEDAAAAGRLVESLMVLAIDAKTRH